MDHTVYWFIFPACIVIERRWLPVSVGGPVESSCYYGCRTPMPGRGASYRGRGHRLVVLSPDMREHDASSRNTAGTRLRAGLATIATMTGSPANRGPSSARRSQQADICVVGRTCGRR